jgi:hypothetical protein
MTISRLKSGRLWNTNQITRREFVCDLGLLIGVAAILALLPSCRSSPGESGEEGCSTLEPGAYGNDKIEITNHTFWEGNAPFASPFKGGAVEIAVKNISGETIAAATFEAVFYDLEGNVIDTVQQEEYELKPDTSRAVYIVSDNPDVNIARCYRVTILDTIMVDEEKVQVISHTMKPLPSGEEEVSGIVKNISDVLMSAEMTITFFNVNKEQIGIQNLVVTNMEPDSTKGFVCVFKPEEGTSVSSYTIDINDIQ